MNIPSCTAIAFAFRASSVTLNGLAKDSEPPLPPERLIVALPLSNISISQSRSKCLSVLIGLGNLRLQRSHRISGSGERDLVKECYAVSGSDVSNRRYQRPIMKQYGADFEPRRRATTSCANGRKASERGVTPFFCARYKQRMLSVVSGEIEPARLERGYARVASLKNVLFVYASAVGRSVNYVRIVQAGPDLAVN